MPITRTFWEDDDGTGTTGTIINNAEKQLIYDQIDASCAFTNQSQIIAASDIRLGLKDTTAFVDQSVIDFQNNNQQLNIRALNDALVLLSTPMQIDRNGNTRFSGEIRERARATPMGDPIDVAFNAGQFSAIGGTWTVTSTPGNAYTVVGHLCTYTLHATGSASAGTTKLIVSLPGGHTCSRMATGTFAYTTGVGALFLNSGANTIELTPAGFGGSFAGGATTSVGFTISYFFQ